MVMKMRIHLFCLFFPSLFLLSGGLSNRLYLLENTREDAAEPRSCVLRVRLGEKSKEYSKRMNLSLLLLLSKLLSLLLFSYPYERVLALVARCGAVTGTRVRTLGHSLQGREVSCVIPGRKPNTFVAHHSRVSIRSHRQLHIMCRFPSSACNRLLAASRVELALLSLGSSTGYPHTTPVTRTTSHNRSHASCVPGSIPEKPRAHFSAKVYCGACSASAATAASALLTAWP